VDLAVTLRAARRGLRSATRELAESLARGTLLCPLLEPLPVQEAEPEVTLAPRLVRTDTGEPVLALFTDPTRLRAFASRLGWATDGDELPYCKLSGHPAFDLATALVNDGVCEALVINPSQHDELVLRAREIAALRQGQPVPLVGYVQQLDEHDAEHTLVSELDEAASAGLRRALDELVRTSPGLAGYRLEQTFNRERDWEPHPTVTLLTLQARSAEDSWLHGELRRIVVRELPPPGYLDVVFEPIADEAIHAG
jgi:hypothetical protein